jgi:DNA-binding LacI/PurR family transcriptional regulator
VARAAGVSTATVSRALATTKNRVSATTRQRVLEAAERLRYRPYRAARALARQRSNHVDVLVAGFGEKFRGEVMDGIEDAVRDTGRGSVYACYGLSPDGGLRRAVEHLLEIRAEGMVFWPSTSLPIEDKVLVAELKGLPTVLIDLAVEGLDLPLVTSDDKDGIRQAVDHLVRLGHDRIAHIAGPSWMSTGAQRLRAFREAMAAHHLGIPDGYIVPHDFTYHGAVVAAQTLLQTAPTPTAVITANDTCAAGLLEVARHMGFRVPDDLSVIGFDDTELCHAWNPPLTTIRQPKRRLGREAIRVLTALIEGEESPDSTDVYLLPTRLIVRGSCGAHTRSSPLVSTGGKEAPMS